MQGGKEEEEKEEWDEEEEEEEEGVCIDKTKRKAPLSCSRRTLFEHGLLTSRPRAADHITSAPFPDGVDTRLRKRSHTVIGSSGVRVLRASLVIDAQRSAPRSRHP